MQLETWFITGSGFHFGRHGLGQEETAPAFPSDSLAAALLARLAELGQMALLKQLVDAWQASPPGMVLSSTFPTAGDVRFFPAVASGVNASGQSDNSSGASHKDLKRVQYVSEQLFRRQLDGEPLAKMYPQAIAMQGGQVLISQAEHASLPQPLRAEGVKLWESERRPNVTLDRASSASQIFFTGRVSFAPGCGLWFGMYWRDQSHPLRAIMPGLLADLGLAGLGGERSTGYGKCEITSKQAGIELPDPDGELWTNLSRYWPRPEETGALSHPQASYKLVSVGGWLGSSFQGGYRRRPVNLVLEGARLGVPDAQPYGRIDDVGPTTENGAPMLSHPVFRSGLALAVGIKAQAS